MSDALCAAHVLNDGVEQTVGYVMGRRRFSISTFGNTTPHAPARTPHLPTIPYLPTLPTPPHTLPYVNPCLPFFPLFAAHTSAHTVVGVHCDAGCATFLLPAGNSDFLQRAFYR